MVIGIYKPWVYFINPYYNPLKCYTHQILLGFSCSCETGAQSQPKQMLLFLYWSQNFPSVVNLREQYMIFWHMHCPRTHTYTQIKCLKYLHIGSKRPFPRLEISRAPLFSCSLTLSAAFSKADLQRCSRLPLTSRAAKGLPGASLPVSTQGGTGRCRGPWAGY